MASNPINPDFKLDDALFQLGKMSRKAADKVREQAEAAQQGAEAERQETGRQDTDRQDGAEDAASPDPDAAGTDRTSGRSSDA